ncbi:dentin sialophosphoprotein-like isoform X2 [Watersipora subatra]|uniref:dentin sialophosphoprotein-like isoform X2 n=1 Tax=Watersipora subatra TaxID=2589382 RepID=UPI00355C0529
MTSAIYRHPIGYTQGDRQEARERRNKAHATVNLAGVASEPSNVDGSLFPVPAVRVKRQNDQISNRIKDLLHQPHHFSSSPAYPKAPSVSKAQQNSQRGGVERVSTHPEGGPQPTDKDKHNKTGREPKKKSDSSEHKHKHKERDKDKKRKSSHSEDRHAKKKSKSTDKEKTHSPVTVREPVAALTIPKKIKHRSSSVCSDRSDLSARSSTDKQSTSIRHATDHLHSSKHSSNKSKHSNSGGAASQSTSASLHDQSLSSRHTSNLGGSLTTAQGSSNSNKCATKYPGLTSLTDLSNNERSANKSREKEDRVINGLIRPGGKPTNLVIPSINASQSASLQGDKDDLPVNKILKEMLIKPTEKITEIQTPCKIETTSPYRFQNINKSLEACSDSLISKPDRIRHPSNVKEVMSKGGLNKPSLPPKPENQSNGIVDDLQLSPSDAGSDSGSSSDSSDSSSSSSSGSESDSSDEEPKKGLPPMLFGLERSPAPPATTECSPQVWDLASYYNANPQTSVANKKPDSRPAVQSVSSKPVSSSTSLAGKHSDLPVQEKRKRGPGRPRKEEGAKRITDPDFTPPTTGKHLPTVAATVTTDRQKRLSSSSKPKSDLSKVTAKRGRPRKKPENEHAPSAVSTNKAIISTTLSVDRLHSKNHSIEESRTCSSASKPSAPIISSSSSSGDDDIDIDVDVDVVSDKSPGAHDSAFIPVKAENREKIKSEPVTSPVHDRLLAKHEPISPVVPKVEAFDHFGSGLPDKYQMSNGRPTLLMRIPLKQLHRPPSRKTLSVKASIVDVPSLPGIKNEKLSPPPPYKRKSTPPSSFQQAMEEAKKRKPIADEDIPLDLPDVTDYSSGGKGPRLSVVPSYTGSHLFHAQAKELKHRCTNMPSNPNAKPLKHLLAVESVVTFMMSGIGKEAEDPKAIQSIKPYYTSTLTYAEISLGECLALKESNSTQPQIHKCTQVLCHYVLSHLRHKCYKLLKDQASSSGKRVEDFLHREKTKQPISPHTHTGLPPGNSPAAPSPASITSTGSLTSDSGRGTSLPPNTSAVSVPDPILRDVAEYMKCMNYLPASIDQWKTATFWRTQHDRKEFFDRFDKDIEYRIDILTDSKPFVHYVHTACLRLKKELDVATSYTSSYS